MTAADYLKLPNEEINRLVATRIMDWHDRDGKSMWWWRKGINSSAGKIEDWNPATDGNDIRLVRDRIAELGLIDEFVRALAPTGNRLFAYVPMPKCNPSNVIDWLLIDATPKQQCAAALAAKGDK